MLDEFIDHYLEHGFCRCGCLLTLSCRLTAVGRDRCTFMQALYKRTCGQQAADIQGMFYFFISNLFAAKHRRLQVNQLQSKSLTRDEACLLQLVAAAQQHKERLLQNCLHQLTQNNRCDTLYPCVKLFARLLDESGLQMHSDKLPLTQERSLLCNHDA